MAATYNVSPDVLTWVFQKAQNNPLPLKSIPLLQAWIDGTKVPTFSQIEDVSNETRIPLGYFFLNTPPEEKIPLLKFRTVKSEQYKDPSRNLIDTIHDMERIIDWTKNSMIESNSEPNEVVGSQRNVKDPLVLANYIRRILGLNIDWAIYSHSAEESFKILRDRINSVGVIVMQNGTARGNSKRPLDVNEFRAFTIIDNYAPLIFINACDSQNAKLFSLLHEFAHICIGVDSLFNENHWHSHLNNNVVEILCNAVAAELLVPTEPFRNKWQELKPTCSSTDDIIEKTAYYFKCGQVVVARKASDLGLINKEKYNQIANTAKQQYLDAKGRKNSSGGNYYATMASRIDRRFFNMLLESVLQGKTQYTEACKLTNTNRITFSELAERMAI